MHRLGQYHYQVFEGSRGKMNAYVDGGEGSRGVSLTNVQVLQTWQVCPVELELACKGIRWVESMVEHPEEHAHVIARLLWGHAEVDEEDQALGESGRLTPRRLQHWH